MLQCASLVQGCMTFSLHISCRRKLRRQKHELLLMVLPLRAAQCSECGLD